MEAQHEYELNKLCDKEVEKAWDKRRNQWHLEKQARQKLLQDVLQSRQKQIEQKCEDTGFIAVSHIVYALC